MEFREQWKAGEDAIKVIDSSAGGEVDNKLGSFVFCGFGEKKADKL